MLRVLPPTNQTCFAGNEVLVNSEKFFQKLKSSSAFCNKKCTCLRASGKDNLFCNNWRNSGCLPFARAFGQTGRSTVWANGTQNSGLLKFRPGMNRVYFTLYTNQFYLPKNEREGLKLVSKMALKKWKTNSVWNIPSGKIWALSIQPKRPVWIFGNFY